MPLLGIFLCILRPLSKVGVLSAVHPAWSEETLGWVAVRFLFSSSTTAIGIKASFPKAFLTLPYPSMSGPLPLAALSPALFDEQKRCAYSQRALFGPFVLLLIDKCFAIINTDEVFLSPFSSFFCTF